MIDTKKIKECAQIIVLGMNMKKDESIVIRGGIHTQELLEEIALESWKKGAQPLIISTSDNYKERMYSEITKEILQITPKHYLGAIKEVDAYVVVEPIKNPKIQSKFPLDKIAATTQANVPIRKILYGEDTGRGKKWTYVGWPTREAALFYNLNYEDLERLIIDGILVSAAKLKNSTSKLAEKLRDRKVLHITDKKGTDFTVKIQNRRINEDDGIVDDEDIEMNDLGNNLPAGELFIAPHETYGDGTLFCPITMDRFTKKLIKNITLFFKEGKLILERCTGDDVEQLIKTFNHCKEIDKKGGNLRTLNVAELGIGCNPAIDKAIGYILTDEKLSGSIHLAFGSNLSYGGTSKSCMHWDFVTDPSVTMEIVDTKERVMEDGKIL
jgi:aminopeptidase